MKILTHLVAITDIIDKHFTREAHGFVCGQHDIVGAVGKPTGPHSCVGIQGTDAGPCPHTATLYHHVSI